MASGSEGRLAATALAGLLAASWGCSTPSPIAAVGRTAGDAPVEDAGPRYYEPHEVDVAARPVAPIQPAYPAQLRALGVEGDVAARVGVRADGSVSAAELLAASDPGFVAAARAALRDARFRPAERAGRPVPSWVEVHLRFRLDP